MTKIDIEMLAEKIFSEVSKYVNRYMADMRKYVDGQIDTVKAHQTEEAQASNQNKPADAGALGELAGTVRNLERRAGRHAEHLLKLESRIHTLEGKKE